MGAQRLDRDLQGAAVDQADDAELLGRGHELAGGGDRAVLAPHAQQAFVFEHAAVAGMDDRLIGERQAVVVERGDDVVGDRHHAQAGAFALRRLLVGEEAVAAVRASAFERLLGAQHRFLAGGGAGRQPHRADRARRRDLAAARVDDMAAHRAAQALGERRDLALGAILQDDAELVAGGAADDVGRAQRARQALADRDDHLVAGVEAIAVIDHREAVDRGDQEGAMALFGAGAVDRLGQLGAQRIAVEMAGQFVARRQIAQPLHLALLLGGDADDAGDAFGAAVGLGDPRAQQRQPDRPHR